MEYSCIFFQANEKPETDLKSQARASDIGVCGVRVYHQGARLRANVKQGQRKSIFSPLPAIRLKPA